MSYGIIRVQKFTKGSVKGIEIHDKRAKDISHTNQDIDFEKSDLNYNLLERPESYQQFIKARIESLNLKKAVRKDAIVMAQILVTSESDFFKDKSLEQQESFFRESLDFIKNKYGEENIVSATVHMDENTPHLHVNFVPVTSDNRLSAKSLFTPLTLGKQHDEFFQQVGKSWGLKRGERGGNKKHLDTAEFKELQKSLKDLEEKRTAIYTELAEVESRLKETNARLFSRPYKKT